MAVEIGRRRFGGDIIARSIPSFLKLDTASWSGSLACCRVCTVAATILSLDCTDVTAKTVEVNQIELPAANLETSRKIRWRKMRGFGGEHDPISLFGYRCIRSAGFCMHNRVSSSSRASQTYNVSTSGSLGKHSMWAGTASCDVDTRRLFTYEYTLSDGPGSTTTHPLTGYTYCVWLLACEMSWPERL